jgi:hypothetical protein
MLSILLNAVKIHHKTHESYLSIMLLFTHKIHLLLEERLWTPLEKLAKDPSTVTARLARFRCLLNERGVAAAPLAGYGRTTPSEPDSCIRQ